MNIVKTEFMVLSRKGTKRKVRDALVRTSDQGLNKQDSVKCLGVQIDTDLNWQLHAHRQCPTEMSGQASSH